MVLVTSFVVARPSIHATRTLAFRLPRSCLCILRTGSPLGQFVRHSATGTNDQSERACDKYEKGPDRSQHHPTDMRVVCRLAFERMGRTHRIRHGHERHYGPLEHVSGGDHGGLCQNANCKWRLRDDGDPLAVCRTPLTVDHYWNCADLRVDSPAKVLLTSAAVPCSSAAPASLPLHPTTPDQGCWRSGNSPLPVPNKRRARPW